MLDRCIRYCGAFFLGVMLCGCGSGSAGPSDGKGGGPTTVTFTFEGPTPQAAAAKIGSGEFHEQAVSSNKASISLPAGTSTFAIAIGCQPLVGEADPLGIPTTFNKETVLQASTADGTSYTLSCPASLLPSQAGTLTGSVDATPIPGATRVTVLAINGSLSAETTLPDLNSPFSFAAPSGTDRVMVLAYAGANLAGAKRLDDQAVPGALNGGNTVVLGAADQVSSQAITYHNVPSGYSASTNVALRAGGRVSFPVSYGSTDVYPALPSGALEIGDSYDFAASAVGAGARSTNAVVAYATSPAGGALNLAFPPTWSYTGPAVPNPDWQPTFDFSYAGFSGTAGVTYAAELDWENGLYRNNLWSYQLLSTANFQNGSTTVTYPDLRTFGIYPPDEPWFWQATITNNGYGLLGILPQSPSNATGAGVQVSGPYPAF